MNINWALQVDYLYSQKRKPSNKSATGKSCDDCHFVCEYFINAIIWWDNKKMEQIGNWKFKLANHVKQLTQSVFGDVVNSLDGWNVFRS